MMTRFGDSRLSRVEFVRRKYRLGDMVDIDYHSLGRGPVMDEACFHKFIDGDPSPNHKYLDWMLFQAGGGQDKMARSLALWSGKNAADPESLRNQCHHDFLDHRTCPAGYIDEEDKELHKTMTKPEAEAAWSKAEERIRFEFIMG